MNSSSLYPTAPKKWSKYFRLNVLLQSRSDETCWVGYFPIAVIKQLWPRNLQKKEFALAYGSRGVEFPWGGNMGAEGKHGSQSRKLGAHSLYHKHKAEKANWKWRAWFLIWEPALGDVLPPARLRTPPNSSTSWGQAFAWRLWRTFLIQTTAYADNSCLNPSHAGLHLSANEVCEHTGIESIASTLLRFIQAEEESSPFSTSSEC